MTLSVILPTKSSPDERLVAELKEMNAQIFIQREPGITNAVWHGLQRVDSQMVAIMDADGSHRASDLKRMVKLLNAEHADLVVASRLVPGKPLFRKLISLAFNILARVLLGLKTQDPMSAFFLGDRSVMRIRNMRSCKFGLELQLRAKKVREVFIAPYPRAKSYIKPMEGIYLLLLMVRLKACKRGS